MQGWGLAPAPPTEKGDLGSARQQEEAGRHTCSQIERDPFPSRWVRGRLREQLVRDPPRGPGEQPPFPPHETHRPGGWPWLRKPPDQAGQTPHV